MNLKENDLKTMTAFIREETGINLPDTQTGLFSAFLFKKLHEYKIDPDSYIALIKENRKEYESFIDSITNNETYFFREEKHFEILHNHVFKEYALASRPEVRIWSASCSTGEEPISLLALAQFHFKLMNLCKITIHASDINPMALNRFRSGVYTKNSFRKDGASFHRLLDPLLEKDGNIWQLSEKVKPLIHVHEKNIYKGNLCGIPDGFDIVFLRNTFVYMPAEARMKVLDSVVSRIAPDGYLFLAMSECPLVMHPLLEKIAINNVFFYRKKGSGDRKEETVSVSREIRDILQEKKPPAIKTTNPDWNMVLDIVRKKQNTDRDCRDDDENPEQIVDEVLQIIDCLNTRKPEEAKQHLQALVSMVPENELCFFFSGNIEMMQGDTEKAVESYKKTLEYNNLFWPARFYLGMLLKDASPQRAMREFMICNNHIEEYIKNGESLYEPFLEGFNARYFQSICRNWIDKNREVRNTRNYAD